MLICAAVQFHMKQTDKDVVIPCLRHKHAYEKMCDLGFTKNDWTGIVEGFVTHQDVFLDRVEAFHHALACGQLSETVRDTIANNKLFSEDLY